MKRAMSYASVVGLLAALVFAATAFGAGGGTGITATPASTQTFDGGTRQATFVRSASDIINETNRVGLNGAAQNNWSSQDVWIQFRPMNNPYGNGVVPNSACESTTVPGSAPFTIDGSALQSGGLVGSASSGYFIPGVVYNVCVYFVHTYATDLSVAPNPVIQGHDVVFASHLLVDGTASATPPATIKVHAYDTDSTCTTEAWYGPFSTTQNGVNYTTDPLNASAAPGDYYYKAEAAFATPTLTRWSACTKLTIAPHDYTLTLLADGQSSSDQVDIAHHTIYTGVAKDGAYVVSGAAISFDVFAGTACTGTLIGTVLGPTTDGSGTYTFDGGPDPAGVYSVKAYTSNATSNCVDIYVGATATLNDVTSSPATTWSCAAGATGGTVTTGTVYWVRNQVTGDITVKITGAPASTTYDIWVEQNPGTCPPGTSTPSNPAVPTDSSGNATFTFTPAAGATNFWLSMWTPAGGFTGTQVLRSVAVTL